MQPRAPRAHRDLQDPLLLPMSRFSPGPQNTRPSFQILHTWQAFRHRLDFWLHDQFHVLLSFSLAQLVVVLVIGEALLAVLLAMSLAVMTGFNAERCLGLSPSHTSSSPAWAEFYYFTVETMFTIGFGAPRHPSCTAANVWTTVAVLLTNVIHALLIGIVFAKFSSGSARGHAVSFSSSLLGQVAATRKPDASHGAQNLPGHLYLPNINLAGVPMNAANSSSCTANEFPSTSKNVCGSGGEQPTGSTHLSFSPSLTKSSTPSSVSLVPKPVNGCQKKTKQPASPWSESTKDQSDREASRKLRQLINTVPQPPPCDSPASEFFPPATTHVGGKSCVAGPHQVALQMVPQPQPTANETHLLCHILEAREFQISFRIMNLTEFAFFKPKMSIYLLHHDTDDLLISQIHHYTTDLPLQFLELPITVTVHSRDLEMALLSTRHRGIPITRPTSVSSELTNLGSLIMSPEAASPLSKMILESWKYEVMALLSFVDNHSSTVVEVRKSWRLSDIIWGYSFQHIVKKEISHHGLYQVNVEELDSKSELYDSLNNDFATAMAIHLKRLAH